MSNLHENNSPNKKIIPKGRSKSQLKEDDLLIKWINELKDEEKRTKAICKLSEYSEKNHNLPIYLWYSQGTMAILLQEIISSYKIISSDKLTQEKAAKICNILLLLNPNAFNVPICVLWFLTTLVIVVITESIAMNKKIPEKTPT